MIDALHEIFSSNRVKTDADSLAHWGRDWTRSFAVAPSCGRVSGVDRRGRRARASARATSGYGLVPSGGRTGLSGGAVAGNGEIVVSFDRMNKILAFDPADRIVRCQAGVVTQALQQYAAERGLFYPVDFASSGSSQIGGNISTNAGGIKVIRYGLTRDWVAGLKVVTGTGEVLELNRGLVKNATGYDLRHLFIGAEGTLGFVVEAEMQTRGRAGAADRDGARRAAFSGHTRGARAFSAGHRVVRVRIFLRTRADQSDGASKTAPAARHAAAFYALRRVRRIDERDAALRVFEACVEARLGDRRACSRRAKRRRKISGNCAKASPKASRRIRHTRTTCRCASPPCRHFSKRSIASSPPRIPISKCAGTATSATATCTSTS